MHYKDKIVLKKDIKANIKIFNKLQKGKWADPEPNMCSTLGNFEHKEENQFPSKLSKKLVMQRDK